jgi:hypothetical protein
LAKDLSAAANTYVAAQSTKSCSPASYQETCWSGFEAALGKARLNYCLNNANFCSAGLRDELTLLHFVNVGMAEKTTAVTASTTLASIPYQRLSFGAVGAYIGGGSASRDRVKVAEGKVVADPMGRAMTAVVLNFHQRFNPKAPRMERGERWRGFTGVILTPNLGIAVGAGYGLLRSLSVNAGYGLLVTPALRDGDVLNEAPASSTKPFKAGPAHVWFVGFGYKFGK